MNDIFPCKLNTEEGKYSCLNCKRRPLSLLDDLLNEELSILEQDRYSKTYKAGEVLFQEGEDAKGLICLHTGKVKITKAGLFENALIVALKKPVDFIGLDALVLEKKYDTTATALEDTIVCILKTAHFLKVIKSNIGLSLKVTRLLASELRQADTRMLNLTQKHMRARMADALLLLYDEYGTLADNKTLNVKLKRADLAAMANMTVANAIRVLSLFTKEMLIETNKRQIKIKNMEGLNRVGQLG